MSDRMFWELYRVIETDIEGVDPTNKAVRLPADSWYVYLRYQTLWHSEMEPYLKKLNIFLK